MDYVAYGLTRSTLLTVRDKWGVNKSARMMLASVCRLRHSMIIIEVC